MLQENCGYLFIYYVYTITYIYSNSCYYFAAILQNYIMWNSTKGIVNRDKIKFDRKSNRLHRLHLIIKNYQL